MATRFEVVLYGDNPVRLRAAGEEALDEIERLEAQLSLYRPSSEIAHLNARAAAEPVRVSASLFALLQHARELSEETEGAFDITIAPLVWCWGFMDNRGRLPEPAALVEARANVGMELVRMDAENLTVRFRRDGVMLDLGAIGKGYAIERAAELLVEAGVTSGLIHGGTSTVHAIGHPPGAEAWMIALAAPPEKASERGQPCPRGSGAQLDADKAVRAPIATVALRNEALSVSAVWGRCFEAEGKVLGHVLEPRTGQPVDGALMAAVVSPSATETDALSTALLIVGKEGHEGIANLRAGMRTMLVTNGEGGISAEGRGIERLLPA
jgi:thiamine biosynthesis lipoprotein